MTAKNDQRVAVSYPHGGQVSALFMRSMLHLFRLDAVGARRADGSRVGGRQRIVNGGALVDMQGSIIATNRNRIVREFLALDGIDWLWMVDTDMTFEADIVERLIEAAHPTERPIVGGLCFAYRVDQERRLWPTLYGWIPDTERLTPLTSYPPDTLLPVAATGAACLLVHRSVLEAIAKRFPPPRPWFDETPFYQRDNDGSPIMATGDEYGEDITFCLRAQACGFPVHVDTGIKLGHRKEFTADEDGYIAESMMLDQPLRPQLPTYVVVASRDRAEMLEGLCRQLEPQATKIFVFDNGYQPPLDGALSARGWPLHRMWNAGLDLAAEDARGRAHNVLVVNDDVEVGPEFLARLEAGLRLDDRNWIAYPDETGTLVNGATVERTCPGLAGQTMTGWAFLLRAERGLRLDEDFVFWYGDSDLERRVRGAGGRVVCVGGARAVHLDPLRSTLDDPERLAQAEADERLFADRYGLDPESLWVNLHREKV